MKTELTGYRYESFEARNAIIRKWHTRNPELTYAELGEPYGLSKQRVATILNPKPRKQAAK